MITLAIATMAFSSPLFAAKDKVTAYVTQVTTDDKNYGQCMAKLSVPIADSGLDCPKSNVSFSCSGDFNSKDTAYHKFEIAQISLALDKKVIVYVDDTKKHNGYCYAYRIDLRK